MKTSKIKIRPFVPCQSGAEREPFAVLKYGNVTVELDYTIMLALKLDIESEFFGKTVTIAHAAFTEIIKEMHASMYGRIEPVHRDGDHPYLKSRANNPLHPSNTEHITV